MGCRLPSYPASMFELRPTGLIDPEVYRAGGDYGYVVASKDWHIDPGEHYAAPGTNPDFETSWPVHCAAGT